MRIVADAASRLDTGGGGLPYAEAMAAALRVTGHAVHVTEDDDPAWAPGAVPVIDGLLLPGGCDLSPRLYGGDPSNALDADPVRDAFELALLEGAIERGLPVLGICRGMELINVSRGGTLRNGVTHPDASDVHVDALGNVTLALRQVAGRTRAEADEVGRAALARVGLADRAGHRPAQLSGGSSSASPLRGPWRWSRGSCCSTSRPARWTRSWWATCWA